MIRYDKRDVEWNWNNNKCSYYLFMYFKCMTFTYLFISYLTDLFLVSAVGGLSTGNAF